jgi:HEPN domain-containing protein
MGFYAEPWLREARDRINSVPDSTSDTKSGIADFGKLADAVEKAIKAALVENHGSIPRQLDNQNLVSICQATGVWDILPPALKGLVKEVELFRSASAASSQEGNSDSSAEQLQRYFIIARGLIDYMEFHVIGNDSVLKRLKVT